MKTGTRRLPIASWFSRKPLVCISFLFFFFFLFLFFLLLLLFFYDTQFFTFDSALVFFLALEYFYFLFISAVIHLVGDQTTLELYYLHTLGGNAISVNSCGFVQAINTLRHPPNKSGMIFYNLIQLIVVDA
jgi:hypothetical protein